MNSTTWTFLELVIGLILLSFLSGLIVMVAWNAVIPVIFGLTVIDFWQACWLVILCSALFRSYPGSSSK